jgi:hypothetical protein
MNKTSFIPIFEVGLANEDMPACRQINTAQIDPAILAGMCISILDSVISKLPDESQISFEEETANLFNYMVDSRHGYVSTVKFQPDE